MSDSSFQEYPQDNDYAYFPSSNGAAQVDDEVATSTDMGAEFSRILKEKSATDLQKAIVKHTGKVPYDANDPRQQAELDGKLSKNEHAKRMADLDYKAAVITHEELVDAWAHKLAQSAGRKLDAESQERIQVYARRIAEQLAVEDFHTFMQQTENRAIAAAQKIRQEALELRQQELMLDQLELQLELQATFIEKNAQFAQMFAEVLVTRADLKIRKSEDWKAYGDAFARKHPRLAAFAYKRAENNVAKGMKTISEGTARILGGLS